MKPINFNAILNKAIDKYFEQELKKDIPLVAAIPPMQESVRSMMLSPNTPTQPTCMIAMKMAIVAVLDQLIQTGVGRMRDKGDAFIEITAEDFEKLKRLYAWS